MPLISVCPYSAPENIDQTFLSHMTEEELRMEVSAPQYKWYHKLFQIFCFLIFLGPIRLVLCLFILILFGCVGISTRLIVSLLGYNPDTGYTRSFLYWLGQRGLRVFIFTFGIVHIRVRGRLEDDTRIITANHVSFLDPLAILVMWRVSCLMKKEFSDVPSINKILDVVDPIYVDRSKSAGATMQLMERARNFDTYPLLIFPEGTICGGRVMLKFHLGAFLTPFKSQGVCIRYCTAFLPEQWNTYVWTGQSAPSLIWTMLCMPPSIVDLTIMPQTTVDGFGEGNVETYALKQQLAMANELGLRAVDLRSDVLFRAKKN